MYSRDMCRAIRVLFRTSHRACRERLDVLRRIRRAHHLAKEDPIGAQLMIDELYGTCYRDDRLHPAVPLIVAIATWRPELLPRAA